MDDLRSSVKQKITEDHYISLFRLLAAPSNNSESSAGDQERLLTGLIYQSKQLKIATAQSASWFFLCF
jgi:hypothetical protein